MKPPILVAAKLARPRTGRILRRGRLQDALAAGVRDHPVTLVRAGAGYGKTTLLAGFADDYPGEVVWYSLGPEDSDGGVFLWHLVGGLQLHSRRYGRSLRALLLEAESARSLNNAAAAFLNDLSRMRKPVAIVLDDFHLVNDSSSVIGFLSSVIEHMDSPVRFVIAARQEPPLPLARLRARRQLAEIDGNDLCFSRDEVRELLEEVYQRTPSNQTLNFVSRTTEGWVTAIQLVLALDPGRSGLELPTALRHATEAGSSIHDYLAQEVLALQSPEDRGWLLRASVFEELEPATLSAVLGEPDSESRLHRLVQRSLVHPFDTPQGRIFRFHALLRDFLFRRFQSEVPAEERAALHRAAAAEFLRRDNLVAAARQLALSGDSPALAGFLRDHSLLLLEQGHYQVLLSWFEELPSRVFDEEPWLRLRLGDVRHYLGDWPGAELEYERAQSEFARRGETGGEAWAVLGLLRIWNLRGESERVVAEGEKILEAETRRRGKRQGDLLIRLLQVVSGAHFYLGRYTDALAVLDRMERLIRGNPDRQSALWNNRGVIWASQGNYQKAVRAFERGLERPGARRSPRASLHLCNLALTLSEMGDTERAQILFREAQDLAAAYRNRSQILSCQIGLANLFFRMGNLEKTMELIKETESINADLKIPLVESYTLALRARILCDRGQYGSARTALTQALAACSASGRDANWLGYRIQVAVVDLRAGRVKEAYRALLDLLPLALEMEAWFPRTMLLFHLGDAELRLGLEAAEEHLADALSMGQEMGYEAFLRDELRRSFDPFSFLLLRGRSAQYIRDLAVSGGPAMEQNLLRLVGDAELPAASARAVLGALSEIGGAAAHELLAASPWSEGADLRTLTREALRDIRRRHPQLQPRAEADGDGIHVATLGVLTLTVGGLEMPRSRWKSQRALYLFVYLALRQGRGATKDRLMDLFWPGKSAAVAGRNFHPTLSYVRAAFKGLTDVPVLPSGDGVYDLNPDLRVGVDARRFETKVSEARALRSPRDRLAALQDALALYRGDFLADIYEPWTEDLRSAFSETYEQALEEAAGLRVDLENHAGALEMYQKLVQRNPFREEIHSRIMMCYHHLGDRRSLKQQFGSLQRLLREELDVDPLPETSSLYETLMVSL